MDRTPHFTISVDADIELRLLEDKDAAELFQLVEQNRGYLRRWLPWVDYETSVEDSQRFVRRSVQQYLDNENFDLGIKYQGRLVGMISIHTVDWPNRQTDIGYWLEAASQSQGVMTKACRALVDYIFHKLQLHRVTILCATGNERSRAIPERLGFFQEGTRREGEWLYDHFVDLVVYSMLAHEWDALYLG